MGNRLTVSNGGLRVWPDLPALQPPSLRTVWENPDAEWRLAAAYLGPLIDGSATLLLPGFWTDGGSIPRAAWSIVGDPWQLPCLAYFLPHDADYAAELRYRGTCDTRLLQGMRLDGHVDAAKRVAIYRSVRDFGGICWNRHTPEGVAAARKLCRVVGEEEYLAIVKTGTPNVK
ncbi:MAG TPA: hypothetical protein PLG22_07320 [Kiritimatiellia bacterium]|nr:hypothetical protein [Kiritimatiellia bacterium]